MVNLANLAEEIQIAHRQRIKLKKGDFVDENSATTESDLEETLKILVVDMKKSPQEVFDALKNQTVDLVFTAHPTQSVRISLLQKHGRIRNCLAQLYAKRYYSRSLMRFSGVRIPPTPQDELRAGMSYFHETVWKGVLNFLRRVDTALKNIGINERVPYNAPLIQFSSWMGGDRDGNPRVTPEVTRDVCFDELRVRTDKLHRSSRRDAKHYIEFWKHIPPSEPYRVNLGNVRDKLYQTRERSRQLLSHGISQIPEEATFTNVGQVSKIPCQCSMAVVEPLEEEAVQLILLYYLNHRKLFLDHFVLQFKPDCDVKLRPHICKPADELVKLNPTSEYAPGLEGTLILTMKGIAAGMQNTG
ncbi:hypothetical protein V6N11_073886 [Hibiscus sabdariffa]|uniref:Phosphoenolpyruvate carboxylase n=1 Tax=Hibiscus sabdariffa TaxID=183260 RepID=A0ABR2P5A3_9ROSI